MRSVTLPAEIVGELEAGAALAISISGGKDSQAMVAALVALHAERGWTGEIFCIHADLGRIEWRQTPGHVRKIAADAGLRLEIVRRTDGRDMIEHWVARGEKQVAQGKQGRPWSDSGNRFCTSDMKRDPIDNYLRRYSRVVCAVGIRHEESPARAKKQAWERRRIDNTVRTARTWHPILNWVAEDVWNACGTTGVDLEGRREQYRLGNVEAALEGWPLHPAYVFGNERVSCQFCVLATCNDLQVGADQAPELLEELIQIEDRFGFTFQNGRSLKQFRREQPAAEVAEVVEAPTPVAAPVAVVEAPRAPQQITYLSGCIRPETLQHKPDLGFLITPLMGNKPAQDKIGVHAHDNGVYSEFISGGKVAFKLDKFLRHLDIWRGVRMTCLFATAPDVVGDWRATLERSAPVLPEIRKRGYRAALVAQDGLEHNLGAIPWDDFDVLFLGGGQSAKYLSPTNRVSVKACKCSKRCKHKRKWVGEWKCTPGAARLVAMARARGKDVHMGRVNSFKRLAYAQSIGCTSADGTLLQFPQNVEKVQAWIDSLNPGLKLPQANCPVCRWHAQAYLNTYRHLSLPDVLNRIFKGGCPHNFRYQAPIIHLPARTTADLAVAA